MRKHANIVQTDMADKLSVSISTLQGWEQCRHTLPQWALEKYLLYCDYKTTYTLTEHVSTLHLI